MFSLRGNISKKSITVRERLIYILINSVYIITNNTILVFQSPLFLSLFSCIPSLYKDSLNDFSYAIFVIWINNSRIFKHKSKQQQHVNCVGHKMLDSCKINLLYVLIVKAIVCRHYQYYKFIIYIIDREVRDLFTNQTRR